MSSYNLEVVQVTSLVSLTKLGPRLLGVENLDLIGPERLVGSIAICRDVTLLEASLANFRRGGRTVLATMTRLLADAASSSELALDTLVGAIGLVVSNQNQQKEVKEK